MGICHSRPAVADAEVEIPEDIWMNILSRLTNIDLLRFHRVSKYHQSLIDSPDFLRTRSDLSIKKSSSCFILSTMICGIHNYYIVDIDLATGWPYPNVRRLTNPIKGDYPVYLAGGFGGILCLVYELRPHRHGIMFWNPLTSRRTTVFNDHEPRSMVSFRYYFGHDAVTDDFKVLKISYNKLEDYYICEIYSSRKNSWKCIGGINVEERLELRLFLAPSDHFVDVFVEGTNSVHMIASNCVTKRNVIVAFNFATEKFNLVPLPWEHEYLGNDHDQPLSLSSLRGRLCYCSSNSRKKYEVWMMKDYGIRGSWSPACRFTLHADLSAKEVVPLDVVTIHRKKLIVFSCNQHPGLFTFDLLSKGCEVLQKNRSRHIIRLPKPRAKHCSCFSSIPITYKPSLRATIYNIKK